MKISFSESQKLFAYFSGLIAALSLFIYYVSAQQSEGALILCITFGVIAAGIWFGPIYALAVTLIVLFVLNALMMFSRLDRHRSFRLRKGCECLSCGESRFCCFLLFLDESTILRQSFGAQ